jgi:ribonuclease HI
VSSLSFPTVYYRKVLGSFLVAEMTNPDFHLFIRHQILHGSFIRRSNKSEFCIYTDGVCCENGNKDARGGCAFVYRPKISPSIIPSKTSSGHSICSMNLHELGASKLRLKSRGPTGAAGSQTSNRATTWSQPVRRMFGSWNMAPQKSKSS